MINKTDCFAYESGTCRILDDADCENCSTYKTWEQTYQEQKKCEKRLKNIAKIYQFEYSIPKEILQQFRKKERNKNG